MVPTYRLSTFVLAGGYCGIAAISAIYVSTPDRYGFSVSKYQQWCVVGLAAGVFAGLLVEFAVRIAQRPSRRFSLREFMVLIAILAAALASCGSLAKWANRSERGISNASVNFTDDRGHSRHR
jgi:H+/Cl- antiporter ClcA